MTYQNILTLIPSRWIRYVLLPGLFFLLSIFGKAQWAQEIKWRAEVDAVVQEHVAEKPVIEALKTQIKKVDDRTLDLYKDQLKFQADIYRAMDEKAKARAADKKSDTAQ